MVGMTMKVKDRTTKVASRTPAAARTAKGARSVGTRGATSPAVTAPKATGRAKERIEHTVGSGNVFADLGLPDPDIHLAKARLAEQILAVPAARRCTQAELATLLGIDQPKVSALARGRLEGFSIERLCRFLTLLGQDVAIVVRPRPGAKKPGRLTVVRAERVQ